MPLLNMCKQMLLNMAFVSSALIADAQGSSYLNALNNGHKKEMIPYVVGAPPPNNSKMRISPFGLAIIGIESRFPLIQNDISEAENVVNELIKVPMTQGHFDSFVGWVYFHGKRMFLESDIPKLMNDFKYKEAGNTLLRDSEQHCRKIIHKLFAGGDVV